jgi:MoxR-like ATPase
MKEYAQVRVEEGTLDYVMAVASRTREHPSVLLGASTRAAVHLAGLARWQAAMEDRAFVIPDDVKAVALPALRHRLILKSDAEIEGRRNDDIVREIIDTVKAPR